MRVVSIKTLAAGIFASVLLMGACKKGETGPAGPAGTNGTNGFVPVSTDGFIKGNISGTREGGIPFNESFDFRNYWGSPSGLLDSITTNSYSFSLMRGQDIWGDNYASINVNTVSTATTSGTMSMYFTLTKSLGPNKQFRFTTNGSATMPITVLSYNTSTGLFTGSFTYSISAMDNSSGNPATISGSFQATMTQIYNRASITGADIKG